MSRYLFLVEIEGCYAMIGEKEEHVYLVTGGCGFIGSHIAEALVQNGEKIRILDDLSTGREENIASFRDKTDLIVGDIRDDALVDKVMEGITGVFHEAALVSVGLSVESPRLNHEINILGTFNILEAARRHGVRRVVCASSAAVYGDDPRLPKKESYKPEPASPYGASKAMNEIYAALYTRLYGVETVALRYFNVYGERQDPASPYSGVLSLFKKAFEKEEPSITLYGDGKQTRDFVYVKDVAAANILVMGSPSFPGDVFNVGTGKSVSLQQVIGIMEHLTGKKSRIAYHSKRPGDIRYSEADVSALHQIGFQPVYSIEEGLRSYLFKKESHE